MRGGHRAPVQQDAELEDGDAQDLRRGGVEHETGRTLEVRGRRLLGHALLVHADRRRPQCRRAVRGRGRVVPAHERPVTQGGRRTAGRGPVGGDADRRQLRGAPAEGDELGDEHRDDARHGDRERIRLGTCERLSQ